MCSSDLQKLPSAILSVSENEEAAKTVQTTFSNLYFRVYTGTDLMGAELAGALKNCLAIAAGIADEMGYEDNLYEGISEVIEKFGVKSIIGMGLATHGLVDRKKGTVIFSPHFKWKKLEIRKELEKKFNLRVIVENDVRAMLTAEHMYGCAGNMKNFMMLYIRNGVGSAIFLNGKIFEGSNCGAGEIGHFIVKESSTIQCRCGKFGCLETEYSEQALINKVIWEMEQKRQYNPKEKVTIDRIYNRSKHKEEPYYSKIGRAHV